MTTPGFQAEIDQIAAAIRDHPGNEHSSEAERDEAAKIVLTKIVPGRLRVLAERIESKLLWGEN